MFTNDGLTQYKIIAKDTVRRRTKIKKEEEKVIEGPNIPMDSQQKPKKGIKLKIIENHDAQQFIEAFIKKQKDREAEQEEEEYQAYEEYQENEEYQAYQEYMEIKKQTDLLHHNLSKKPIHEQELIKANYIANKQRFLIDKTNSEKDDR